MLDTVPDIRQRLLIAKLPAMPQVLLKLIQRCQDEQMGMAELADLIGQDPAMAGKVLGAASSALYAGGGAKPSLMRALQTLGMDSTRTLLICDSVFQVFNGLVNTQAHDLRGFWRHSLMAAVCAKRVAVAIAYPHLEEAYLAGLLHDVGRLALLTAVPKEYAMLSSHIDDASLCLAEERMLRITHAEAGALLLGRWGLGAYLADSALYHHQPMAKAVSTHPLIRAVILADTLACQGASQSALPIAQALCGIDAEALATICNDAAEQVRQTAALLQIDLAETDPALTLLYPSVAVIPPADFSQALAVEVQQMVLNSTAKMFYSQATGVAGVLSAIRESAGMLFGFKDVMLLLRDDASRSLRGVALESCRSEYAEFMMPLDDGGVIALSMAQRRTVFIESGSQLPRLSGDQPLLLQVSHGKVKPNARPMANEASGTAVPAPPQTLTLAEEQLLRMLDTEYLVCLPLLHGEQCLGVAIGAALALQIGELQLRETFLTAFACQAAAAIDASRRKEEASRQSEAQIAAEFRLASRKVVHEVSNPLTIIKNYLAVLGNKVTQQEPVAAEIAILSGEIDRVGQILKGLTDIKPSAGALPIEVDRVVGDIVRLYAASLPPGRAARVRTRLQAGAMRLLAEADSLKQILHNLIKNASEAIPPQGDILIGTQAPINRDGRLHCAITVQDNGPGIAPDVLAQLFSPLATRKGGEHMGLGLSIVHGLVKKLDGIITCRSDSAGTTFEILLPVAPAASDNPAFIPPVQ